MKLPEAIRNERGVSPVIGVILMVAITVILAAVIGSFVLGIGGNVEQTPQASLSVQINDTNQDNVTIAHEGGDTVDFNNLNVTIDGQSTTIPSSGSLDPGQTFDANYSENVPDGATVRVVHEPTGGMIVQTTVSG